MHHFIIGFNSCNLNSRPDNSGVKIEMSLCFDYDFQKWNILSLGLIAATLTVGLFILIGVANGQSNSDFYLEANVIESGLKITKFEIQGNSEGYKWICPSLQCKIDYKDKDAFFSPPDIPENTQISSNLEFTLQDNITNADLGPKKKELVEQHGSWLLCSVYDIVEKNGQELYYCHSEYLMSNIYNKIDHRSSDLNITGIYDAKNDILKISGNFTQ